MGSLCLIAMSLFGYDPPVEATPQPPTTLPLPVFSFSVIKNATC